MAKYQEILDAVNELKIGFGRLDERTQNTYHLVEKLERHNAEQNGYTRDQGKQTASNKTSINRLWWLLGIAIITGGSAIGLVNWLV